MNNTTPHDQRQPDRAFGVVVGGYGSLWGLVGLLALAFGLLNITDEGLGAVAAMVMLFGVALPALLFALPALVCALGLWQGRHWSRSATSILAVLHLLGALFLLAHQLWVLGLLGVALSAAVWWYLRR